MSVEQLGRGRSVVGSLEEMTKLGLFGELHEVREELEAVGQYFARRVVLKVQEDVDGEGFSGKEKGLVDHYYIIEFFGKKVDLPMLYKKGDRVVIYCNLAGKKFPGVSGEDRYILRLRGFWIGRLKDQVNGGRCRWDGRGVRAGKD